MPAETGSSVVVRADAHHLPLADGTVDLVVTSPPYFALRSYTDGGEHYAGQVGDEPTPAEFIDALLAVTAECVRVLKPSGSLWVNLGDKYARTGGVDRKQRSAPGSGDVGNRKAPRQVQRGVDGVRDKSLIGLPWRYALGCIDELGLILRAEVIWSKPNGLPESVTDRVRRSHEQWFHFTAQPRYFSAVDEIREPHVATVTGRDTAAWAPGPSGNREVARGQFDTGVRDFATSPLGKLPGSVWTVPTQPLVVPPELGVDHFAAFPTEWPKRIIQGWSPSGVCVECGEGRRPVAEVTRHPVQKVYNPSRDGKHGQNSTGGFPATTSAVITGYACACPEPTAPTRPAVVLDPFGGTGTTAMVARALGRTGISVDLSADYCRLARWRTEDPAQRAKVRDEPFRREQPQHPDQGDLFDMLG